MELKLYNTLTRKKEVFRPLDPARVRMYVCGPTVYDFAHIGNARPVIVFDVLYRLLRHRYGAGHVKYVRNITDVDDKINARAAEEYPDLPLNEAIREVTRKTEAQFHEDVAALGCLEPDVEPRATEHIAEMKELIERMLKAGCAYVAEDHVLFHVASMKDYGKLANRSLDEMLAGARVEVAPYKRDPMDFVLWKPSKPGEPAWPSPGGIATPGRPGWHLECSAMSWKHLGETFDIHAGGIDLVFPHHENEIAQSRCAFHTDTMAQVWMHNGFLQVEGEKMAKSAGNFVTICDLLKDWPGDVVRLQMLMTHYRQPIDWTRSRTVEASQITDEWFAAALRSKPQRTRASPDDELVSILGDDLNTPEAITYLHELSKSAQKNDDDSQRFTNDVAFLGVFRDFKQEIEPLLKNEDMQFLSEVLRLGVQDWLRRPNTKIENYKFVADNPDVLKHYNRRKPIFPIFDLGDVSEINPAIESRLEARKRKDFSESDRIRDKLAKMGVVLKDSAEGTTWEVAR